MDAIGAVHECLFCSQTFSSAIEKDDHVLEHFSHETCSDCDQNLIRIGGKLYTLHDAATCVRKEFKPEPGPEPYAETCIIEQPVISSQQSDGDDYETENFEPYENSSKSSYESTLPPPMSSLTNELTSEEIHIKQDEIVVEPEYEEAIENHTFDNGIKIKTEKFIAQSDHEDTIMTETEPIEHGKTKKARNKKHTHKFECGICKKVLKCKWNLSLHMRAMHNSKRTKAKRDIPIKRKIDSYECFLCKSKLHYKQSLERHILVKHVSKQKPFKCELCSARFSYESARNIHRCPVKYSGEISGASITTNSQRKEINRHIPIKRKIKDYECYLCKGRILHKQSLERHMLVKHVSKEKPYQCDLCLARFLYEIYRNKHPCPAKYLSDETSVASTSNDNQMFNAQNNAIQCQICNGIFDTKQSFTEHVSIHNWDGKQFKCKPCSASFWQAEKLEEHSCIKTKRTHIKKPHNPKNSHQKFEENSAPKLSTKTEMIVCHICGKSLQTYSLQNHIKYVHSSNLHECDICKSTFRSDYSLKYHKRVQHDPNFKKFECELCSKPFAYVWQLRKHKVVAHSSAEVLFCKICAKVFSKDEELDTHMTDCRMKYRKWHQRKMKVVECTICRTQIKGKTRFIKHMREAHGQEI